MALPVYPADMGSCSRRIDYAPVDGGVWLAQLPLAAIIPGKVYKDRRTKRKGNRAPQNINYETEKQVDGIYEQVICMHHKD